VTSFSTLTVSPGCTPLPSNEVRVLCGPGTPVGASGIGVVAYLSCRLEAEGAAPDAEGIPLVCAKAGG
jgi:hypothetical protein